MIMISTSISHLPSALYRAEKVREMDRFAIEKIGIPGIELMNRAGQAAFRIVREKWPHSRRMAVVCGAGNNGGDGYVVARLALEAGMEVRVYALSDIASLRGDARSACQAFQSAGGKIQAGMPADFGQTELIVDAMLGTGLDREVTGKYAKSIEAVNRFSGPVLAIDIPSGLQADTGFPLGQAVRAAHTATFIGLKQGLFTGEAADYCGEISYADLDVPRAVHESVTPSATLLRPFSKGLPPRKRSAHKGHFGHVLVIGGEAGLTGAARMAAEAAARVGAGLISIASRPGHASLLNLMRPELMCHGVEKGSELAPLLERATVVAIGPGLGQSDWALDLLKTAFHSGLPLVADADALNLLARHPLKRENWILTPHPGEAARLLRNKAVAIQKDRFKAVAELQKKYGGVCVLKGSGTLICEPDKPPSVCAAGNPGMASGGMGDVLTGVLAGLVAQGLALGEAARMGVCLHSAAADRAAAGGERGMLACDLMDSLRYWVNRCT